MKVYIYDIACLGVEDIDKYYDSLPQWRRDKLDKYSNSEDKLRSLGASLVLEYALKEWGINLSDCNILYGENGKPYIEGMDTIHFNISHSGTKVAVGVGEESIGVDIQRIRPVNLRLVDRFFTGREDEYINLEIEKFHEIWCLKESYLKCIGTGLTRRLKEFEVIPGQKMSIDGYELHLENVGGYKLGICTSALANIEIEYLDNINDKV